MVAQWNSGEHDRHPPETIRRAAAVHPITAIQTEWSLWERTIENEVVAVAREMGIAIVPYSPLGRGGLTGVLRSRSDVGDEHRTPQRQFGVALRREQSQ